MGSLLVHGSLVLTMDRNRPVMRDGAVYAEDDEIVDVGPYEVLKAKHRPERTLGGGKRLVMPGFVDAHDHYINYIIRQLADDRGLFDIGSIAAELTAKMTLEDLREAARACMAEQVKSGITTVFDDTITWLPSKIDKEAAMDTVASAASELGGVRIVEAVGGADYQEGPQGFAGDADTFLDAGRAKRLCSRLIKRWNSPKSSVAIWPSASHPLSCTAEMYSTMKDLADQAGTGTFSHAAETLDELRLIKQRTGKTVVQYLDGLGYLGKSTLLAHAVWVTEGDISTLKRSSTKISHQPVCNQYFASGIAPVPRMVREGMIVGLGIDDGGHTNEDFFALMKHLVLMHRGSSLDVTSLTAEKALEMATIDGAKSLNMEKAIGSLEVGKKADMIVVDLARLNYSPHLRPIMALVYAGMASDVESTIIGGRIVMENRRLSNVDEEQLMDQAEKAAFGLVRRAKKTALLTESHLGWKIPAP